MAGGQWLSPRVRARSGWRTLAGGAVAGGAVAGGHWLAAQWLAAQWLAAQWREAQWQNQAVTESRSIPPAWERSRARVVSACELVEDVGDEGTDDGDGVGDAAAGAGRVDDECAQGRSVRDADEAS